MYVPFFFLLVSFQCFIFSAVLQFVTVRVCGKRIKTGNFSDRKRKATPPLPEGDGKLKINMGAFHRSTHTKESVGLESGAVLVEGVVVKRFKILRGSHQLIETESFIGYDWVAPAEQVGTIQDFAQGGMDILPCLRNKFT